ncbi:MAG: 16S rRNA (guanine(966)-N(2))-methyltransferase RsmD [Candidatus Aminicenantes bacterium RBG_13_63_10]|nr:MAG: 16S rRNA (guanine(966)-N(2))-methyltransferase RsmD [Candidatus Aminicenantes bacterium RBG_13_63_10]
MLKVIRGRFKGKRLKRVSDPRVRPMPDKLKEALFHVLEPEVRGARVLDGFAGTGSVGIEALSRGAESVVFVEEFPAAASVLRHNLARCGAEDQAEVVVREFNRAVIQFGKDRIRFDLIFLDPPYRLLDERDPLKVIWKREVLEEGGRIILRRHRKTRFEPRFFVEQKRFDLGDDTIVFYGRERGAKAASKPGAKRGGLEKGSVLK